MRATTRSRSRRLWAGSRRARDGGLDLQAYAGKSSGTLADSRGCLMVSAEDRTTQERVIENWGRHSSSHETDRLLPLFSDGVVYEDVTMGAVNHGTDEL